MLTRWGSWPSDLEAGMVTSVVWRLNYGSSIEPNLYTSRHRQEMNQKWLFVCSGKIKISCRAFLDGHPVKILKLSHQDMNQKCKTDQTNHIYFLQDLTQICTQKYNQKCSQLLNFPVQTKINIWFISGWLLDKYRLGHTYLWGCMVWSFVLWNKYESDSGSDRHCNKAINLK